MKRIRVALLLVLALFLAGCGVEVLFGLGSLGIGGYGLFQRYQQTAEIRALRAAVERHQEEVRQLRESGGNPTIRPESEGWKE